MVAKTVAVLACVALLPLSLLACNPRYAVTDLGTLGGEGFTRAEDINQAGHVTGLSRINDTVHHAFIWNGATMSDLGSITPGAISVGGGINATDQVAGVATMALGETTTAQVWTASARVPLDTLGGSECVAAAINDAGLVAGAADLPGDEAFHAVLWNAGQPNDLGTLGGLWSLAQDVNQSGHAVGWSLLTSSVAPSISQYSLGDLLHVCPTQQKLAGSFPFPYDMHAVLWNGSALSDLGTLGGVGSVAAAINDSDDVVGMSRPSGSSDRHAVIWNGGSISDLGTLGGAESVALDVNNSGHVVGWSQTSSGAQHAFYWDGVTMIDLNDALDFSGIGWELEEAAAINDSGQIAGTGRHDGLSRAFVLTPLATPAP